MQSTLRTFNDTEIRTIWRALRADNKTSEKIGDYSQIEYNEIIMDKLELELMHRLADK
jgi:hypothetical protein